MTYKAFLALAKANGWTLPQCRFDVLPPQAIADAADECGEHRWLAHCVRAEKRGDLVAPSVAVTRRPAKA